MTADRKHRAFGQKVLITGILTVAVISSAMGELLISTLLIIWAVGEFLRPV